MLIWWSGCESKGCNGYHDPWSCLHPNHHLRHMHLLCLRAASLLEASRCKCLLLAGHYPAASYCLDVVSAAFVWPTSCAIPGDCCHCRKGWLDGVKLLLAAGAEVDLANKSGLSALGEAVARGHVEVADALLEAGADPDWRAAG